MIEAAYDRIAAAIRHSRGSQLIAVVVRVQMPLITATSELQSSLLRRGTATKCLQIRAHHDLLEPIDSSSDSGSQVFIVHGLEGMPSEERESFLRATSFARSRLRTMPVPIILVLGEETWSWLGMELPDLARWMHGPFVMGDDEHAGATRSSLHIKPALRLLADVPFLLDEERNVEIDPTLDAWIDRGGVLLVGGPPGVGITSIAARARDRLEATGVKTAWTNEGLGAEKGERVLRLDEWIEQHRDEVLIVDREFSALAAGALQRQGLRGLVLGSSLAALGKPEKGVMKLYVPPVQVVEADGAPHSSGVAIMVKRIRYELGQQLDIDIDSLMTLEQLELLGQACGGLPGLMWRLVADAEHRTRRIGLSNVDSPLIRAVVIDMAKALAAPASDAEVERAIQENLLDFGLEARGAVLFYVIDGRLRTLQHPLMMLARRLRAASEGNRERGAVLR